MYLLKLERSTYLPLVKFRTSNHHLPIETGRWNGIDINDRKCTKCPANEIGDEFHYLLECPYFKEDRVKLIKKYYYTHPNVMKYKELMATHKIKQLRMLSKFIAIIILKTKNPPN